MADAEQADRKSEENKFKKEIQKKSTQDSKEAMVNKTKMEVDSLRMNKRENKAMKEVHENEAMIKNQSMKVQIKQAQKELEVRKRQKDEEKKIKAKSMMDAKIMEENKNRLQKESEVAAMEQEELELIQKLQNTQLMQRQAYEDLENALANYNPTKSVGTGKKK